MRTSRAWWCLGGALGWGVACALACSSSSSNGATSKDAGALDATEDGYVCEGSTCGEPLFDSGSGLPQGEADGGPFVNAQGLCYACLPVQVTPLTCFASTALECSTYNGTGCDNQCIPHWTSNPDDAGCDNSFRCEGADAHAPPSHPKADSGAGEDAGDAGDAGAADDAEVEDAGDAAVGDAGDAGDAPG